MQHPSSRDRPSLAQIHLHHPQNPTIYSKQYQPRYQASHKDGRITIQTRIFLPQSQLIQTEVDPKTRKKTLHQVTKILARRFQPYTNPELDYQNKQDGEHYRRATDRGSFPERRMEPSTPQRS